MIFPAAVIKAYLTTEGAYLIICLICILQCVSDDISRSGLRPCLMLSCAFWQEVQLYTADPDPSALSTGLRAPALISSPVLLNHKRLTNSSKASPPEVEQSPSEPPDKQTRSATMTHCSASSLHAHGPHGPYTKGFNQGTSQPSAEGVKPEGRMREVSADSEEVKTSSSVGRNSGSPELSSPAVASPAGPCGTSFTQRANSGELQTGSGKEGLGL